MCSAVVLSLKLKCLRARFVSRGSHINLSVYRNTLSSIAWSEAKMWMVLLLVGFPVASFGSSAELRLVNEWKIVDFSFPSEQFRQYALNSGAFIPGNAVLIDVDVHYKSEFGILFEWTWNFSHSTQILLSIWVGISGFYDFSTLPWGNSGNFGRTVIKQGKRWIKSGWPLPWLLMARQPNRRLQ